MNFLVTGGAGFIGSNIVETLLKRGHKVRVLDNFSTGRRENISDYLNDIELIEGDIRSYHTVNNAVKNVEVILHQAALPSVPRSISDPITSNQVNTDGTLNVLDCAKENDVRRVVIASSSSVYGDSPELPKKENMIPNPLSPYAVSKLASEKYAMVYNKVYGLETIALRYFNVFGPKQDPNSQYSAVIPKFITAIMHDKSPIIYGDGETSRDFTYVENVVEANILAGTKEKIGGEYFNCACHGRVTLNQLIEKINLIMGKNIKPHYNDFRLGDIKHSFADINKIQSALGFSPSISFDEGLIRTIKFYKK